VLGRAHRINRYLRTSSQLRTLMVNWPRNPITTMGMKHIAWDDMSGQANDKGYGGESCRM